ncbi:hypothetical protein GTO89_06375 [Heliobacterium gestii]|uniref:Uncharacterized protein n=1 Tax=Heliomicrobium gestii TaxID=2699 RepID=A0A845LGR7_HELGE|nr:hypothetical protein [Heliomicrobium gestii]MZP42663.1 hypothetical protein [Heliomicrobium gestii]
MKLLLVGAAACTVDARAVDACAVDAYAIDVCAIDAYAIDVCSVDAWAAGAPPVLATRWLAPADASGGCDRRMHPSHPIW